jgi:hypothetical protein
MVVAAAAAAAAVGAAGSHHSHPHHHVHTSSHAHQPPPHPALVDAQRLVTSPMYAPSPLGPDYAAMTTPPQPVHPSHALTHSAGVKRRRPDNLDLTGISDPGAFAHQNSLGISTTTGAPSSSFGHASDPPRLLHHHHHLPDSVPPSKMARREDAGGSPCVVGHQGMPEPAPRPKGPKLKFTPEDDQLLIQLKENKNLTWKQISDFFPGRTSGTLQVRYCTKLKAKSTKWTDETVSGCFLVGMFRFVDKLGNV